MRMLLSEVAPLGPGEAWVDVCPVRGISAIHHQGAGQERKRAAALSLLACYGPSHPSKCLAHDAADALCNLVTVAERLLDPYVHCGRP